MTKLPGKSGLGAAQHRPLELQHRAEAAIGAVDRRRRRRRAADPECPDLAVLDAALERCEQFVVEIARGRLMQQQDVDIVRAQGGEAALERQAQLVRREARAAHEPAGRAHQPALQARHERHERHGRAPRRRHERAVLRRAQAEFRRDRDLVAFAGKRFAQHPFGRAEAIGGRGIEMADAAVERRLEERKRGARAEPPHQLG